LPSPREPTRTPCASRSARNYAAMRSGNCSSAEINASLKSPARGRRRDAASDCAIAGCRDRERGQMIGVSRALNALEREASRQELGQRRVIEQRDRTPLTKTAKQHGHEPAGAARGDAGNIGTIDVPRAKIPPDSHQAPHRPPEIRRVVRERCRIDRARALATVQRSSAYQFAVCVETARAIRFARPTP